MEAAQRSAFAVRWLLICKHLIQCAHPEKEYCIEPTTMLQNLILEVKVMNMGLCSRPQAPSPIP